MKRSLILLVCIGLISIACVLPGATSSTDEPQTQIPGEPTSVPLPTEPTGMVSDVNVDEGLLAYYPFDGNGMEASGLTMDGQLNNVMPTEDRFGLIDGALLFNGIDSMVVIPDDDRLELTGDFSISFFIQGNRTSNHEWLIMTKHMAGLCQPVDTSWMLRYDADNGLRLVSYDPTVECGKTVLSAPDVNLLDDQWHHLVVVRKAETISLYVDGESLVSVDASMLTIENNSVPLVIGNQTNGIPAHNLDAVMDEVRFYDRAISEDVIETLFVGIP